MTKKKWYRVIFFLLVAVIVLCGFMVGKDLLTQKKEKDEFSELADIVVTEEEPGDENQPVDNPKKTKKRNIEKLIAKNGDCIGWIYIAGTEVNYPVMYSVNEPQKYLHRNFYGEYSYSGVPFLDARCSLDSQNLIVYGYNGIPAMTADDMYNNAKKKGTIDTIPEVPGLAVWHTGHIGIYIGNGEVIEAMGTKYGVVKTKLSGRGWTHWLEVPHISYPKEEKEKKEKKDK